MVTQLFLAIGQEPWLKLVKPLQLCLTLSPNRCINRVSLLIGEPSRVNFSDKLSPLCLIFFFRKKRALLGVHLKYIRHHNRSQRLFLTFIATSIPWTDLNFNRYVLRRPTSHVIGDRPIAPVAWHSARVYIFGRISLRETIMMLIGAWNWVLLPNRQIRTTHWNVLHCAARVLSLNIVLALVLHQRKHCCYLCFDVNVVWLFSLNRLVLWLELVPFTTIVVNLWRTNSLFLALFVMEAMIIVHHHFFVSVFSGPFAMSVGVVWKVLLNHV